ncbi:response regulator transcription factor [bacterium]|nr:response regulator transcription factor [bacterium]
MAHTSILIVDDEPLARQRIADLLKIEKDLEIVGQAKNGLEAIEMITSLKPDLVFLDVQMPEVDGFGVISTLGVDKMPHVIFVTAYDQYALQAFEVNALDYLLKPFDQERFHLALQRARLQLEKKDPDPLAKQIKQLLDDVKPEEGHVSRLIIKSEGRIFFIKTVDIDWIEAAGNYVTLHVGSEEYLIRETMTSMEAKLDPSQFIRIHRSNIVNIESIKEIKPWFNGEYHVDLKDGAQLTLSRKYRQNFKDYF